LGVSRSERVLQAVGAGRPLPQAVRRARDEDSRSRRRRSREDRGREEIGVAKIGVGREERDKLDECVCRSILPDAGSREADPGARKGGRV